MLGAYADGRTGCSYVQPSTLQEILGWGRDRREAAQRELVRRGWLRLGWKRGARARWARRVYFFDSMIYFLAPRPLRDFSAAEKLRNLSLTTYWGPHTAARPPSGEVRRWSGQVILDHERNAALCNSTQCLSRCKLPPQSATPIEGGLQESAVCLQFFWSFSGQENPKSKWKGD